LIWTMWDVNIFRNPKRVCVCCVWSELCGMWTISASSILSDHIAVWSELCGMWTFLRMRYHGCVMWFDLNYVGCELFILEHKRAFTRCLIWTMWDVNQLPVICAIRSLLCLIWTMWDVNQVWDASNRTSSFGLIWTMWDVNISVSRLSFPHDSSLIWTMWDVNQW